MPRELIIPNKKRRLDRLIQKIKNQKVQELKLRAKSETLVTRAMRAASEAVNIMLFHSKIKAKRKGTPRKFSKGYMPNNHKPILLKLEALVSNQQIYPNGPIFEKWVY